MYYGGYLFADYFQSTYFEWPGALGQDILLPIGECKNLLDTLIALKAKIEDSIEELSDSPDIPVSPDDISVMKSQCVDTLAVLEVRKSRFEEMIRILSEQIDIPTHTQTVSILRVECTDELMQLTLQEAALSARIKKLQSISPINR